MTRVRTAIVIGGGIAGPVAALALHRAGIEATVHESYPTSSQGVGGTIALAPNGIAALGIVGAAEPAIAVSQPAYRQVMTVGSKRIDLPRLPDAGPFQVIHRSDLNKILSARVRIEHGHRLVEVHDNADSVTAVFADGTSATADVLIGADGVHSTVRRLIDPDAPGPRWTGMLAFEGLSRASVDVAPGTMTFAFGKRGYYLYWPAPGGGTTFGVNLPHPTPLTIREARAIPAAEWLAKLRDVYGEDTPGAEIMRLIDAEDVQVNGALHIMPPVPHWYRGRMVLVGDAVHAPSNSSGQGASLAIESAIQLARCLRDLPVPDAFATYERLRRARVEGIAAQATKINQTKTPGPVGQILMPLLMPLFTRLVLKPEKTMGPIQRYRIDFDAAVA